LFLRELHPVENVYQRLHRQQEEAPGDTTLRPLFAAPSTRTKDGLPASTRKLGSQTSESVLDGLRSLYLSRTQMLGSKFKVGAVYSFCRIVLSSALTLASTIPLRAPALTA
jgi:hypothetical protein